jgi:ATP-dependent Clp protease ATP-binding subunit ClpA
MLNELHSRLHKLGLDFSVSHEAKAFIISNIETDLFGARPLKRKIELLIENPIASKLVQVSSQVIKEVQVEMVGSNIEVSFH